MAISMGLSVGLLYVSHWIGMQFTAYVASGLVVGNDEAAETVTPTTSCAIPSNADIAEAQSPEDKSQPESV